MLTVRTRPSSYRPRSAFAFDDVDRLFSALMNPGVVVAPPVSVSTGARVPAINVSHDEKAVYVEAELPGFKAEELDISVVGDELTLRGKREAAPAPEGATAARRERWTGSFERTIRVPFPIRGEAVIAEMTNGVLTITLPKHELAVPRKIPVNIA